MKTITIRAKAFSCEPRGAYRVTVDPDGRVRVWDSVAGYYTLCHALTTRDSERIRQLLRGQR